MKSKKTTKKNSASVRLELNEGELIVEVDHRGHVYCIDEGGGLWSDDLNDYADIRTLELSATELDRIAKRSKEITSLIRNIDEGIRQRTRASGFKVSFIDGETLSEDLNIEDLGNLDIGCQHITAAEILDVHAASRRQRGLK